jgi:hypothetical protein
MPQYTLDAYIIHDETARFRETGMNNTLKTLKMVCQTCDVALRTILITHPNSQDLQKDMNSLQSRVKYEKTGDEDFDNRMHMLSLEMISNTEKHKEAWRRIHENARPNTVSLVLEDDAYIMPDFVANLAELLQVLPSQVTKQWDICFLGTTRQMENGPKEMAFSSTREVGKIIPTKESYIIAPHILQRLTKSLETMRYTLRIHLSWFLHKNQEIRSVYASKPIFLDGSKIGTCTSTIHPMNPLVINREFMEMWQCLKRPDISMSHVRAIYKKLEHLRSPDALHLYGRLLVEHGDYNEAETIFMDAVRLAREQNGVLGPSSALLSDAIANYKNIQKDIQECREKPSKYTIPDRA